MRNERQKNKRHKHEHHNKSNHRHQHQARPGLPADTQDNFPFPPLRLIRSRPREIGDVDLVHQGGQASEVAAKIAKWRYSVTCSLPRLLSHMPDDATLMETLDIWMYGVSRQPWERIHEPGGHLIVCTNDGEAALRVRAAFGAVPVVARWAAEPEPRSVPRMHM